MKFAGDLLMAEHYELAAGETPGFAFNDFDAFAGADIAMVNLESPVTVRGTKQVKPFTFRMNPSFIPAIVKAGISIVNLANNHIFDFGEEGLFDTIDHLDSAGLIHIGAGRNHEEAHRGVILETRGRRVGFLGYYGGSEAPPAIAGKPGVAKRELSLIRRDIARLKENAEFVVVNFHWGKEKESYPADDQVAFARAVIDAGANAIIGHHPHVLQGIEWYNEGIIVYSLGNFVFGGNSRHTYDTAIFEIRLCSDKHDFRLIPLRIVEWRITEPTTEESERILRHVGSISRIFPMSIFHNQE